MRILFVGDVVGRSGRTVVSERLPGLVRDWKLDLVVVNGENAAGGFGITEAIYRELIEAGADAVTLGNHAWDQREALVFIERARATHPAGQLSAWHARPRRGVDRSQERRAGARDERHGPHFHGRARRSVRRRRPRADELPAWQGGRRRHRRYARRGDERETGDGVFLRRPGEPRSRHPHARTDRGSARHVRRHRFHERCRHDRRLRFGHRHGQGRAVDAVSAQNPVGAVRAGVRAGDIVRGRSRNRCRNWAWPPASAPCASAAASNRQRRRFGSEIAAPADLYFRPIQHYESPLRASLRSAP